MDRENPHKAIQQHEAIEQHDLHDEQERWHRQSLRDIQEDDDDDEQERWQLGTMRHIQVSATGSNCEYCKQHEEVHEVA